METNSNCIKIVPGYALTLRFVVVVLVKLFLFNGDCSAFHPCFRPSRVFFSLLLPSLWGRRKLKSALGDNYSLSSITSPASDFLSQSKQSDGIPPISAQSCGRVSSSHFCRAQQPLQRQQQQLPAYLVSRCHTCARLRQSYSRTLPPPWRPQHLRNKTLNQNVALTAAWHFISSN